MSDKTFTTNLLTESCPPFPFLPCVCLCLCAVGIIPVKQTQKSAALYNRLRADWIDRANHVTWLLCFMGIMGRTWQVASKH